MKRLVCFVLLLSLFVLPVSAEFAAPRVPDAGKKLMPEETKSFGQSLKYILKELLPILWPELQAAMGVLAGLIAACMLVGILRTEACGRTADIVGAVAVAAMLLTRTGTMIRLGESTVLELSEYEKLLLPSMTAAMAAQGGGATGAALYAGTAAFITILSRLLVKLLVPVQYLYLAAGTASAVLENEPLKNLKDAIRNLLLWCLRTLLSLFTAYLGITAFQEGLARIAELGFAAEEDAAALKAAKATFSTFIPVVGGILSDASEAVLVGAGVVRSAMGVYGILAILAVFLEPFCRIGIQYLVLKLTGSLCAMFGTKTQLSLIGDFGEVMRMLLGMTGAMCVLGLVSTVCFLKGVG